MANILIATALFPPEPVVSASISMDLASELSKCHEVTVVRPRPSRPLGFNHGSSVKTDNFNIIEVNSFVHPKSSFFGRSRESLSLGVAVFSHVIRNHKQVDIAYLNLWPVFAQLLAVIACKIKRIPFIIHVQDIYPEAIQIKSKRIYSWLNTILLDIDTVVLRSADKVISISPEICDYLVLTRNLDRNKIVSIPNWNSEVEKEILSETNYSDKKFTYLYLGNIGPLANLNLILKEFESVNLKDSEFIVAGSGSEKAELQRTFSHNKSIVFCEVRDGEVMNNLGKADILVLPIDMRLKLSSLPSKMIAYLFSGKPILAICNEDSVTAKLIQDIDCGWVKNLADLKQFFISSKNFEKGDLELKGRIGQDFAKANLSKEENLKKLVLQFQS